jgi:hypothetical protein
MTWYLETQTMHRFAALPAWVAEDMTVYRGDNQDPAFVEKIRKFISQRQDWHRPILNDDGYFKVIWSSMPGGLASRSLSFVTRSFIGWGDGSVNQAVNKLSVLRLVLLPPILLLSLSIACIASAGGVEQQVCDVGADYFLGVEDYSEAIRFHAEIVRKHPDNALAHYHLGFAQGMMGNRTAEFREYQRAEALGLRNLILTMRSGPPRDA